MALLSSGDITTVKDSTLLIAANTIPGDVVEVYRDNMYMGAARPREGNPNWQIDVRLPFYGEHTYEARIRRGEAYSAKASIVINYEEPTPILSDTFAGEINTFIHDHSPDIGLTWIRKYDVVNNYEFTDSNYALTGPTSISGNGLRMADFSGSLDDRWVWNELVPPSGNYKTKLLFILNNQSTYIELALFARGDGEDAIRGYVQWQPDESMQSQISLISEGNVGFGDATSKYNGSGVHSMELVVEGNSVTLLIDDEVVQTREFVTAPAGPGTIGFAFRTAGDLEELTAVSIQTFVI